jgi:membrane protease YdiL (CAAX protease family)
MPSKPTNARSALTSGAVKPWHVVFLFFVAWSVAIVGSFKMTQHVDAAFRREAWDLVLQGIFSVIILAFTVIVPEFRRTLTSLFVKPRLKPSTNDVGLALALALAWGYGLYRVLICLPILLSHPEAFSTLRFTDRLPPLEARYLVAILGSVIVAPIAEELVFRGYLLNLWIARRGVWFAVACSSVVFGAFHLETVLFATAMGIILALVYLRYDSLWPGIFIHAAYNLLAFPWLLGGLFYVKPRQSVGELSSWIPEFVIAVLFIPLAIAFWRRFKPAARA